MSGYSKLKKEELKDKVIEAQFETEWPEVKERFFNDAPVKIPINDLQRNLVL